MKEILVLENLLLLNISQNYTTSMEKIVYILEPVDIWNTVKDENDNNIIERFYDDPKNLFSQMMAYITRVTKLEMLLKTILILLLLLKEVFIVIEQFLRKCYMMIKLWIKYHIIFITNGLMN